MTNSGSANAPPPGTAPPHGGFDELSSRVTAIVPTPSNTWEVWQYLGGSWTSVAGTPSATIPAAASAAYDSSLDDFVIARPTSLTVQWSSAGPGNGFVLRGNVVPAGAGAPASGARTVTAAYDPPRARTIVLARDQTWAWSGIGWRQLATAPPQQTPVGASRATVDDARCDRIVAFGGFNLGISDALDITSTFDGAAWTIDTSPARPPKRGDHAMAYDARRDAIVVFGGRDPTIPLGGLVAADVWEWRGPCGARTWTLRPATGPSPRNLATLTYDARHQIVVLFGGEDIDGNRLDDTWEWDGQTWTQRTPIMSPPARSDHGAVFDPRRQRVVVQSGRDGGVQLDDTWEWDRDAGTWRELNVVVTAGARHGIAFAQDRVGLLAIGGVGPAGPINDILRLTFEQSIEPVEKCVIGGMDLDADSRATCDDPDCLARCAPLCAPDDVGTPACTGPRCGDGTCSTIEDYLLCPADCSGS